MNGMQSAQNDLAAFQNQILHQQMNAGAANAQVLPFVPLGVPPFANNYSGWKHAVRSQGDILDLIESTSKLMGISLMVTPSPWSATARLGYQMREPSYIWQMWHAESDAQLQWLSNGPDDADEAARVARFAKMADMIAAAREWLKAHPQTGNAPIVLPQVFAGAQGVLLGAQGQPGNPGDAGAAQYGAGCAGIVPAQMIWGAP